MADTKNQFRKDQINDLINQWQQLTGYQIDVPDPVREEMYTNLSLGHLISSLNDVGHYMWGRVAHTSFDKDHNVPETVMLQTPWAMFGLSATEYQSQYLSYQNVFEGLTGQSLTPEDFRTHFMFGDGKQTAEQFRQKLLHNQDVQRTYGWLKYGLDYQQFQQRKTELQQLFGPAPLDDQQALLQLQYSHKAAGADHAVALATDQQPADRKAGQRGISLTEVR